MRRKLASTRAKSHRIRLLLPHICLSFGVCLAGTAFAVSPTDSTPQNATWDEVTNHFVALKPDVSDQSERDGALLRKLDPQRALPFIAAFLGKDQPQGVRLNALSALNGAALPESAVLIERIALDAKEDPVVRYSALWPTLTKFDHAHARNIGIMSLRDPERTVRLGAYRLLGEVGGEEAVAALERQFLATDEKGLVTEALGRTKDPAAIKFLVARTPVAALRKDQLWRDAFVRAMAGTPVAEAKPAMIELIRGGDSYATRRALPYLRQFPLAELGPELVALFEESSHKKRLKDYPDLWLFANSPALSAESTGPLRELVREVYPEAEFGTATAQSVELDDEAFGAAIAATFGSRPVGLGREANSIKLVLADRIPSAQLLARLQNIGYPVEPVSRYEIDSRICLVGLVRRIGDEQILLIESFYDSVWGFLLVRQNERWVLVKREHLRTLCW